MVACLVVVFSVFFPKNGMNDSSHTDTFLNKEDAKDGLLITTFIKQGTHCKSNKTFNAIQISQQENAI